MDKSYIVPADLTQAILKYLLQCPCGDVYGLVQGIMSLTPVMESGDQKEKVTKSRPKDSNDV